MAEKNVESVMIGAEVRRSPNFVSAYANQSRLGMTPWDITMIFSSTEDLGPGRVVSEDQVAVRVSPQHFKALCISLAAALSAYEQQFGELHIPAGSTPTAERMGAALSDVLKQRVMKVSVPMVTEAPRRPAKAKKS